MSPTTPRKVPLGFLKRRAWAVLLLLGVLGIAANASATFSIVSTSGSVMYTDFSNGLDANYLSFKITNNGADEPTVWAQLVAGGNITNVGHGQHQIKYRPGPDGADPIGETLFPAGHTKGVFFMVQAAATNATPQTLTINLFSTCSNLDPVCAGGTLSGPLGSQGFSFTVEDTIQANSNKVNTVVTIPANPVPGDLGNVAVSGCTGVVGASHVLYFSPVTQSAWVPDLFEFVDSQVDIPGYPGNVYHDIQLIPPADVAANSTDHCYTDTFTFVINGFGSASVSPNNFVTSGQPVKHTTPGSGSFDVVIPELDLSVVKTQTSPLPANNPVLGGTNVTYHIAVHNSGPPDATNLIVGDSFTVGSATFVSVTNVTGGLDCSTFTALPGQCTKALFVSGADASFDLTVTVPNDGTTTITNEATVASDVLDSDSTNDVSDVITPICPNVDLSIAKTTTDLSHGAISTIQGGSDFLYHVVVTNNSALTSTSETVTDTLPSGVAYVSDTGSCNTASLPLLTCSFGSLTGSSSTSFDIRVTANDSGDIANTATVAGDVSQCDGDSTNNQSTVHITVETVNTPTDLEADREGFPGPTDTDGVATVSDVNRVFEPNETVRVDPVWLNTLDNADPDVTGTASNYTGPTGATYNIPDPGADYGAIPAHTKSDCNGITAIAPSSTGTGDCYEMQALQTDPLVRPHLSDHPRHWDTTFDEDLSTGEHKNWTLHIGDSFLDTPRSDVFYRFIETIFHNHITIGCGTGVNFCPLANTLRTEMSAFIARSVEGRDSLVPNSGTGYNCISGGTSNYTDVAPTMQYCKYINDMKVKLIMTGCSIASQTTYCPTLFVLRGDMATYVARAVEYLPPNNNTADPDAAVPVSGTDGASRTYDCTVGPGPFLDVTNASPYCKYVGLLWINHTVDGDGAGHFLPLNNIKRDEEAKILANAFVALPLYGPLTF